MLGAGAAGARWERRALMSRAAGRLPDADRQPRGRDAARAERAARGRRHRLRGHAPHARAARPLRRGGADGQLPRAQRARAGRRARRAHAGRARSWRSSATPGCRWSPTRASCSCRRASRPGSASRCCRGRARRWRRWWPAALPARPLALRRVPAAQGRRAGTRLLRAAPRRWSRSSRRGGSAASLRVLAELDPGAPVAVCRELTKIHEEVVRGTAAELAARYAEADPRGEVVLVIGPGRTWTTPKPGCGPALGGAAQAGRRGGQAAAGGARRAPSYGRPGQRAVQSAADLRSLGRPMASFYITTPIYYVNAAPHLGHAYTTIAADVMARHHRQRGDDVFFLDGHRRARRAGRRRRRGAGRDAAGARRHATPSASRRWRRCSNASNDFFIRTTDARAHAEGAGGARSASTTTATCYKGVYEGWYCPRCADFKARDRDRRGQHLPDPRDPADARAGGELVLRAVDVPGAPRAALRRASPTSSQPDTRCNEALAFIERGLAGRLAQPRAKLTWGVPVPWDESHVFYVWFDALLNYYTALSYAREGEDLTERFWPADYHLIGKDILKFHTRLLAGDADGRRPRRSRARLRPRLPARRTGAR